MMNKFKNKFLLMTSMVLSIFLLVGCGSLPTKNLQPDGVYTSAIGKKPGLGSFSIAAPQAPGSYEYRYMQTKRRAESTSTYVSFGPSAFDLTMFRVEIGKFTSDVTPELFLKAALPATVEIMEDAYQQKMNKIYEKKITFNGRPARYAVYTQRIPGSTSLLGRETGEMVYTHAAYAVNYGEYGVTFWIQANDASGVNAIDDKNRSQVINRTWKPMQKFVNSFQLYPSS